MPPLLNISVEMQPRLPTPRGPTLLRSSLGEGSSYLAASSRTASMIATQPELCVCEITPAFELSSGTISHHLKLLREAGLVGSERRGTYVYYWIEHAALDALGTLLFVDQAAAQR